MGIVGNTKDGVKTVPRGRSVIVKMQEPKVTLPLDVTPADVMVKGTSVVPAVGGLNTRVVAELVPNAGIADVNEIVLAATNVAVAAAAVVLSAATVTGAFTTAVVPSSSLPPQAASVATKIKLRASLDVLEFNKENDYMDRFPGKGGINEPVGNLTQIDPNSGLADYART